MLVRGNHQYILNKDYFHPLFFCPKHQGMLVDFELIVHRGENQVDGVEQGLPSYCDVERDVRLGRCRVVEDVQVSWHLDDVPRARLPVVRQVHVIFVVVQG